MILVDLVEKIERVLEEEIKKKIKNKITIFRNHIIYNNFKQFCFYLSKFFRFFF